ncbi:MAG TPA: URC4/urg3 family protein [Stellaceae bacterium]|nr:URC4/urg3 family protein [Stellaceae bacterium]
MTSSADPAAQEAAFLLSAAAVRSRCRIVLEAAERGAAPHFRLDPSRLDEAAERVAGLTRRRFPDLSVPLHSRWRHFSVGGHDRAGLVAPAADGPERARAQIDLAIVSVLLDAGAGGRWSYREAATGETFSRSEGLAVASLRAMQGGLFSADPENPWRADAAALLAVTPGSLGRALQHEADNPLDGLEGRARLLRRLGEVAAASPHHFGRPARLGRLYDHWLPHREALTAPAVLETLLHALGPIWPGGESLAGLSLGDCGRHSCVPGSGLVPFHKLSQWLAYSLVEPLAEAGFRVTGLDGLTGLAEYRNGGLFLDCGVLEARDPGLARRILEAASEPVVEWRALTVALLDRLAGRVRERLGTAAALSLGQVLEGGSWLAGREIALERRAGGRPPLMVASDGTVF